MFVVCLGSLGFCVFFFSVIGSAVDSL